MMDATMSSLPTTSLYDQKELVKSQVNREMKEGEYWYLLDAKWWEKWKQYVNYNDADDKFKPGDSPGPIDNSQMIDPTTNTIKESSLTICEVIPKETWDYLKCIYGYSVSTINLLGKRKSPFDMNDEVDGRVINAAMEESIFQSPVLSHGLTHELRVELNAIHLKIRRYQQSMNNELTVPTTSSTQQVYTNDFNATFSRTNTLAQVMSHMRHHFIDLRHA